MNAQKLVSLYQDLSEPISRSAGAKLTYTDLLFRALALALADMPAMNAVWEGEVRRRSQIILGLAVATDRGVVAPVLADVERIALVQLITRRAAITERARQSRLSFADLEGGVGTLSNLGMYRVDRFEGIISPGQSFILAAGKLRERPWVEDKSLVVRPTVILNLSVDHRVADGATAAAFLERIAEVIENPYRVLWNDSMNNLATTIATREVPQGSMALYWLCQAGFAFKTSAGQIVYIDPYLSDVVERVIGFKRMMTSPLEAEEVAADLIICTHEHLDHMDVDALPALAANPRAHFAGPIECMKEFAEAEDCRRSLPPS